MDGFEEDNNIFDSDNALETIFLEDGDQENVQGKGCLSLLIVILVPTIIFVAVPTLQYLL